MVIAVIGGEGFIKGFYLVGVQDVFVVNNDKKKINELVDKLLYEKKHKLLIIEEPSFNLLSEVLKDRCITSVEPLVFVISKDKETDESLKLMMKRALGVDIENI
ncbi:MAG: hypothetical protein GXN99_01790 [Candidatus Nanohaloarchaeota archaeon]|nr:hypothetical protein [Candidatus Nanohaloarchaeota archaeon]